MPRGPRGEAPTEKLRPEERTVIAKKAATVWWR